MTAAVRRPNTDRVLPGRLAARAAVILATAASAALLIRLISFGTSIADPLARDAIGDHRNCALQFRLVRTPVPLEDAAVQFDSAYRLLQASPPDEFSTPDGDGRVIDRHSCTYRGRRFGHVVMRYHGSLVSLLVTASDAAETTQAAEVMPRVIGRTPFGLTALAINGVHHAVMLVGDLPPSDLARLSAVVSAPLARQADLNLGVTASPDQRFPPVLFHRSCRRRAAKMAVTRASGTSPGTGSSESPTVERLS